MRASYTLLRHWCCSEHPSLTVTILVPRIKNFPTWSSCKFSSGVKGPAKPAPIDRNTIVTNQPPLTQALPGLGVPVYASSKSEHHATRVTTLSNGLRIASENRYGQFCTIGGELTFNCESSTFKIVW